jgi:hypothetical protein
MSPSPIVGIEDGRPGVFWIYDVLIDSNLKYYSKLTYVVLARLARTGRPLKYSHAEIAKRAGISVSSIKRGLVELEKAGWLEVIASGGLKEINTYKLLPPIVQPELSIGQPELSGGSVGAIDRSARATTTEVRPLREELQQPEVETPPLSPIDAAFNAFWEKYPRKTAKAAARTAWAKQIGSDPLKVPVVMEAVRAQQAPGNALDPAPDHKRYIPHPASWINGARWTDEIIAAPKTGRPQILANNHQLVGATKL